MHPCPIGNSNPRGFSSTDQWTSKSIFLGYDTLWKQDGGGKEAGALTVFFSIITETNNSTAHIIIQYVWLTSISLLEGTNLYETFAVRESYCSAFATASLVCVSQVSDPPLPLIVSSMVVFSLSPRWTMQFHPRFTWNLQNMMSLQVMFRLNLVRVSDC